MDTCYSLPHISYYFLPLLLSTFPFSPYYFLLYPLPLPALPLTTSSFYSFLLFPLSLTTSCFTPYYFLLSSLLLPPFPPSSFPLFLLTSFSFSSLLLSPFTTYSFLPLLLISRLFPIPSPPTPTARASCIAFAVPNNWDGSLHQGLFPP